MIEHGDEVNSPAQSHKELIVPWQSGCNGPNPGNAWRRHLTDPSAERWFKALPSRQFGPAFTHRLATVGRVADN